VDWQEQGKLRHEAGYSTKPKREKNKKKRNKRKRERKTEVLRQATLEEDNLSGEVPSTLAHTKLRILVTRSVFLPPSRPASPSRCP
jgi:hypothetical protein